jgi:hypothetical protein
LETTNKQPPKRENPHIEDESETSNLESSSEPSQLKVTLDLNIKEIIGNDLIGRWFTEEKVRKYINVQVIESIDDVFSFAASSVPWSEWVDTTKWNNENRFLNILVKGWFGEDFNTRKYNSRASGGPSRQNYENMITRIQEKASTVIDVSYAQLGELGQNVESIGKQYSEVNEDGVSVVDIDFKVQFPSSPADGQLILPENPKHLVYIVLARLDTRALVDDFGITLDDSSLTQQNGEVRIETVIDNFNVIGDTLVFKKVSDGKIWRGPINNRRNEQEKPTFYTYSTFGPNSEELTVTRVPNNKLQDFRNMSEIEKLEVDFSVVQNEIRQLKKNNSVFKTDNIVDQRPNAFFSQIYMSRSRVGKPKFAFAFDKYNFVKSSSKFQKIYEIAPDGDKFGSKKSILSFSKINKMKILRRRINEVKTVNQLGNEVMGEVEFDSDFPYEIIASGKMGSSNQFITDNLENDVGGIRMLDIKLTNTQNSIEGVKFFSVEDRSMIDITDGLYQYGVEIEVRDGAVEYMNVALSLLRGEYERLLKYYNLSTNVGMTRYLFEIQDPHIDGDENRTLERAKEIKESSGGYNPTSNRFTKKFKKEARKQFSSGSKPWNTSPNILMGVMEALTDINVRYENTDDIKRQLKKMISPVNGSPKGISSLLSLMEKFIKKISYSIETSGSSAGKRPNEQKLPQSDTEGTNLGKNRDRMLKIQKWFTEEEFDSDTQKNYGYQYLDTNISPYVRFLEGELQQTSEPGLRTISANKFLRRVERETSKYFNSIDPNMNIQNSQKNISITDDDVTNNTSFGFLTPTFCTLGQDSIKLNTALEEGDISDELYSLLEVKIINSNLRNAPTLIELNEGSDKLNPNALEYKQSILNYFANYGVNVESVTSQEKVPASDNFKKFIPPVSSIDFQNFELEPVDDNDIDKLIKEKEYKPGDDTININPNSLLLSIVRGPLRDGSLNSSSRKLKTKNSPTVDLDSLDIFDIRKGNSIVNLVHKSRSLCDSLAKSVGYPPRLAASVTPSSQEVKSLIKALPNQIKSLLINSVESNNVREDLFSLDINPVINPQKASSFNMKYNLINKIEVLSGFQGTDYMRVKNEIWTPLTFELWDTSRDSFLLCRMQPFESKPMGIKHSEGIKLPVEDIYFILATRPGDDAGSSEPEPEPGDDDTLEEEPDEDGDDTQNTPQTDDPDSLPFCPSFRKTGLRFL